MYKIKQLSKHKHRKIFNSLGITLACLISTSGNSNELSASNFVEHSIPQNTLTNQDKEFSPNSNSIIATIKLRSGSIIFLKEQYDNESNIGYLTTGNVDISELLEKNASALEIYNHYSNKLAPQAIIEQHYLETQQSPRQFNSLNNNVGIGVMPANFVPYQNLTKNQGDLWNLANYGELYRACPEIVTSAYSSDLEVAPVDTSVPGAPVFDYDDTWHDFRYDLTHIKAGVFSNKSHKWESQYGSNTFVGPWGYQRDILMGIGSWQLTEGFRASEYNNWKNGNNTVLPWNEYDIEPCSGNCKDANVYYWFLYCDYNEDQSYFNDIRYELKIKGENGISTWYSPPVQLNFFGEGARYHSSFSSYRRYSLMVTKKDNIDSDATQERYFVYMRTRTTPVFKRSQ